MTNNNPGNKNKFPGKNSKVAEFFSKYGVLFALGGCALIIGGTWFFTRDKQGLPEQAAPTPAALEAPQSQVDTDLSEHLKDVSPTATIPATPAPTAAPAAPKLRAPVEGKAQKAFSVDKMLYSETLGQWQTHAGVDFAVTDGQKITAPADGAVVAVYSDQLWGNCVEIRHADGKISKLCGLKNLDGITKGSQVKQGAAVGIAGGNIPCEQEDGLHVHYELRDGEKPVNVQNLFTP